MICRTNILLILIFTVTIKRGLSETYSSTHCRIPDKIRKYTYDFAQLSSSDTTTSDKKTSQTIRLNLCSPLSRKCGGKDGYSICLTTEGREIGIAKSPLILTNVNNTLLFNTTGGICRSDQSYTVLIMMKCDYSATDNSSVSLLADVQDPCKIHILWQTKFACVPQVTTNCSVVDRFGNTFDLSPLTQLSDNYVVYLDNENKAKMIINVCHSIIHEYDTTHARAVGALLVNKSEDISDDYRYSNYGELDSQSLSIEDNTLILKYASGDLCVDPRTSVLHHQTTIYFLCDPKAIGDTEPKLSNDSKPCDYKFTWKTAAACTKTILGQQRIANTECTIINPITKIQFDLQPLMKTDFTANSTNNTQYQLRICGPLLDGRCAAGTGICDTKNSASAGTANSNLIWRHGGPYLNYTDGASCENGRKRYTIIAFVCGAEGSQNLPIILKDEPCYLIIHWYTDLLCNKNRISCDQHQTNLVPLIRNSKNYVVKGLNGTEFHINICRPVVPTPGLACPHGSAVCQAVRNSKGQYTNETSLGFPDENPVLVDPAINDQNLYLNYNQGSSCREQPEKNISSTFKFFCDYKGDVGLPEYKSYSDCHYIFEWRTNIVCGAVVGEWLSPCTIKDSSHSHELDLSLLYQQPIPRFVTNKGKNYSINICGGKEHCNGSAVCQERNGYGTFSHVTFDYRSKVIKLQYSNGTKCSKESYASELSLICNHTAGIGDPVLKLEPNCSALFEWQTTVACLGGSPEVVPSDPVIATEKTSIDSLEAISSVPTSIITGTLVLVIIVIGIWLYLRNPRRCAHLRSRISAITSTKNHSRVQYSRVNTTEEARLLLDTSDPCTDGHIDSDDELLGV